MTRQLYYFETEEEAIVEQEYDYECTQEALRLLAISLDLAAGNISGEVSTKFIKKWEASDLITTSWDAPPKVTLTGLWTYEFCPYSDRIRDTIEYSDDLFPVEDDDAS